MDSVRDGAVGAVQDEQGDEVAELGARMHILEAALAAREGAAMTALDKALYRLKRGATLSRREVAAFFDVSVKTVQRMQARGLLRPCAGLDGVLRYRASDVLKLASA